MCNFIYSTNENTSFSFSKFFRNKLDKAHSSLPFSNKSLNILKNLGIDERDKS